jgi:hypothetical protein
MRYVLPEGTVRAGVSCSRQGPLASRRTAKGIRVKTLQFLSHQEIYDRAVAHLLGQGRAALLPRGGGAYRGNCGGCPIGSLIRPSDYASSMEGIPIRHLLAPVNSLPAYMDAGIAALRRALLRARVNAYDVETVKLLSCLQNVHDVFGIWEWRDRLVSIARQFGLNAGQVQHAA